MDGRPSQSSSAAPTEVELTCDRCRRRFRTCAELFLDRCAGPCVCPACTLPAGALSDTSSVSDGQLAVAAEAYEERLRDARAWVAGLLEQFDTNASPLTVRIRVEHYVTTYLFTGSSATRRPAAQPQDVARGEGSGAVSGVPAPRDVHSA